jgi:hypothetical protein
MLIYCDARATKHICFLILQNVNCFERLGYLQVLESLEILHEFKIMEGRPIEMDGAETRRIFV